MIASRSWSVARWLRVLSDTLHRRRPTSTVAPTAVAQRPRPTIFIECTHTYHSDLNTGIQRVVRNVLRNAPAVAHEYGYDVVPVIVEADRFRFADAERVLANKQSGHGGSATNSLLVPPRLQQRVWRALLRILAAALPFPAVRAFLYAPPHRPGLARALSLLSPFRRRSPPRPVGVLDGLDDYDRCDGSILLLLDSSWATPIWPGTVRFKQRGGMVVGVICDLIPITHSFTCVPELTEAFKDWIAGHLRFSDGFVCISGAVADTLADHIRGLRPRRALPSWTRIDHFHLGSELDFIESSASVRPAIRDIFTAKQHVFLVVGTIEPRKMHSYVLDGFDRYWAGGNDAVLVIVGRYSWKMEAFLDRAANHSEFGRQLFVLRDVTDAELDYCYRNASSLVIASQVEGFGLPVVEAFQRGLPVMCSDIPVFREIADGKAVFFSLSDPANLTAAVEDFCNRVPVGDRSKRVPQGWISWRQSTEQLFAAIMRIRLRPQVPIQGR